MKHKWPLLLVLCSFSILAQNFQTTMGVSRDELLISNYDQDSTANAVVVYNYGNSYFNKESYKLNTEIKQKIKVLTNEGLNQGNYEVILYKNGSNKELIKDIRAVSYNLNNGQIEKIELDISQIYRETNDNYDLVKFAVPNLKKGSVFTVSYRKITPFTNKFEPWDFQGDIPVIYSEYNTSIPGNFEYHIKLVGNLALDYNSSDIERQCLEAGRGAYADCVISKYIMTNIPAYKEESYTTTSNNYRARIEYELAIFRDFQGGSKRYTETWDSVEEELKNDKDFGRQLTKQGLVKDVLPINITSISNELDKAKTIYNFVLNNYNWNGRSGRYDVSINRLLKEGTGSVFELNLLLLNLLKSEGIEAFPIMSSTRSSGFITKLYPVLSEFTYLFIKTIINGKTYYLDCTDRYQAFGEIPFALLNGDARVIDFKKGSYWETINIKEYSIQSYRMSLKAVSKGKLEGTVIRKFTGYFASNDRKNYFENQSAYITNLEDRLEDYKPSNVVVSTTNQNSKGYDDSFNLEFDLNKEADEVYFNPFYFRFFSASLLQLNKRTYPIDFGYRSSYNFFMELDLKELYEVVELPESRSISLPNNTGSLVFSSREQNGKVLVYLKLNLKEPIYEAELYPYLKEIFQNCVEIQDNSLILLKSLS